MLALDFRSVDPSFRELLEPIARRHEAEHFPGGCEASITFVFAYSISPECCVLTNFEKQMTIAASDTLGFLYGLGKCLRRISLNDFTPRTIRLSPEKKTRGIYFATHFHNWYVTVPEDELRRYVEDLVLWGMNTLAVWYDIHTFQSTEDPEAVAMRERILFLFRLCKTLGVHTLLGMLANEGFASSDPTLRADWRAGQNGYTSEPQGHYHVELCPSVPGGLRAILETKAAVLSQFLDCPPEAVWLWPYDQGGCTCSRCAPWGGNGYLTTLRKVCPFIKAALPGCKILASTWYFGLFTGQEEWNLFLAHRAEIAGLCDGLIAEFPFDLHFPEFLRSFPLPVYGFEEFSMRGACPWGGFGANPLPRYIAEVNAKLLHYQQGGFMYSEGVYEDVNKCVLLSLFCEPERDIPSILNEYASYEFGIGGDSVVNLFYDLEETLPRALQTGADGSERFVLQNPDKVREIAEKLDLLHPQLDEIQRSSLRYRLVYLRSQIDRALLRHDYRSSPEAQLLYRQLVSLYHGETADWVVSPPTDDSMRRPHSVL